MNAYQMNASDNITTSYLELNIHSVS